MYHTLGNEVAIFASVVTPACYKFYSYALRTVDWKRRKAMNTRAYSQEISMVYLNLGRRNTEKGKEWLHLKQNKASELKHPSFRRNILFPSSPVQCHTIYQVKACQTKRFFRSNTPLISRTVHNREQSLQPLW